MPRPDQALNYRGLAYLAAGPMPLGSSPSLPNLTYEINFSTDAYGISGQPDVNPVTVLADYLTNLSYGAGFPAAMLGNLSVVRGYWQAAGLVVSPVLVDQAEGRAFIKDLLAAVNAGAVWSSGVLNFVSYGDTNLSANGGAYTAPSAPLYSLGDADFKMMQGGNSNSSGGGSNSGPIASACAGTGHAVNRSWGKIHGHRDGDPSAPSRVNFRGGLCLIIIGTEGVSDQPGSP